MKENLVCCFILNSCLSLVITTGAGNQYQSDCCHRIAVSNQGPEDGFYRFKQTLTGLPDFCVGGCVYDKEDSSEPDQEFCFYQAQVEDGVSECLADVPTSSLVSSSSSSTTITGAPSTTTASIEKDISKAGTHTIDTTNYTTKTKVWLSMGKSLM